MINEQLIEEIILSPQLVDGLLSREGFDRALAQTLKQRAETGKSVRIVLENRQAPCGLLRSAIEQKLAPFLSPGSFHLLENGSVVDTLPPYVMDPEELTRQLENFPIESITDDAPDGIDADVWDQHLSYTAQCLRELSHHPDDGNTEAKRIRGCCAELLLQMLLRKLEKPFSHWHPSGLALLQQNHRCSLPIAADGDGVRYHFSFPTLCNCELRDQTNRITEFDAIAVSGLDSDPPESFSMMYTFDITTSYNSFLEKMRKKATADPMQKFRDFMESRGIEMHSFIALVRNPDCRKNVKENYSLANAKDHVVLLPFDQLLDRITEATEEDLRPDPTVQAVRRPLSSPPA